MVVSISKKNWLSIGICKNNCGKCWYQYHNYKEWKKDNLNLIEREKRTDKVEGENQKLKEELQVEREEVKKTLQKAQEWRERQLKEITDQKDKEIEELKAENKNLEKQLAEQKAQIEVFSKHKNCKIN